MTDPTPPRTYTDDEVNAIVARNKRDAEASGRKGRDAELAEQLGVPVDQLKKYVDDAKSAAEAKLDAAQKAEKERDSFKSIADTATSTAAQAQHQLNVVSALYMAGLPAGDPDLLDDMISLVRVDAGADRTAISEAVGKVKERYAAKFAGGVIPTPAPAPSTDPGRGPTGRPSAPTSGRDPEVARQLARRGIGIAS